jgi:pSer/pThr/pTyr-binding forkhead associated (FHA) protein
VSRAFAVNLSMLLVQSGDDARTFAASFTIGRDGTDLPLTDDYVSTRHAKLTEDDGAWYVSDLGSTNGTWLNDARVWTSARLAKGDKLRIGRTELIVVPA